MKAFYGRWIDLPEIGRVPAHKTTHQDEGSDEIDLAGLTPPTHKTTHQDGGSDEIDLTGLEGAHLYVDRGDPDAYDFGEADIPFDSDFHDLDLSAIVPVGTIAAKLTMRFLPLDVNTYVYLRKKGNTNLLSRAVLRAPAAEVITEGDLIVALNSNRLAESYSTGMVMYLYATITGWWI